MVDEVTEFGLRRSSFPIRHHQVSDGLKLEPVIVTRPPGETELEVTVGASRTLNGKPTTVKSAALLDTLTTSLTGDCGGKEHVISVEVYHTAETGVSAPKRQLIADCKTKQGTSSRRPYLKSGVRTNPVPVTVTVLVAND